MMKEKIKQLICSLPFSIKIVISYLTTFININKMLSIKKIDKMHSEDFNNLNTKLYKKNLKKCLKQFIVSSSETSKYIDYLYKDRIVLINDVEFDYCKPTIICVVKNEYDKLINFFNHYNKIGKFNYLFLDNNSSDDTLNLLKKHNAKVYICKEKFSTLRKISWINKIYSTIPNGCWTVLLDADELLVYDEYEKHTFNETLKTLDNTKIDTCGAIMLDLFPNKMVKKENYFKNYIYFQNKFNEKKSFLFNSIYGGIREREFRFGDERIYLIKKHPVVKKDNKSLLIHCHYIYPFNRNFSSDVYFALLHYKLFDSEIEKYKKIANDGSYGNGGGSTEYKMYIKKLNENNFDEIFKFDKDTIKYNGSKALKKVAILKSIYNIKKEIR